MIDAFSRIPSFVLASSIAKAAIEQSWEALVPKLRQEYGEAEELVKEQSNYDARPRNEKSYVRYHVRQNHSLQGHRAQTIRHASRVPKIPSSNFPTSQS